MAHSTDFQISGRIEWQTQLPSWPTGSTSPGFSLLGQEWCLKLSHRTLLGSDCYKVCLVPMEGEGRALRTPFEVVTYMRDPTDVSKAPYHREWHRIAERGRTNIWEVGLSPGGIFVKLDWLRRRTREVTFVCLFYGVEPSPTRNKTEIGNQSRDRIADESVQVSSEVPRDIESLSSDFCRLLEKEVIPDARLECGGRTFQAHRSVLAARSEVFRAAFQNETRERETGVVKVQDVDVDVLEKLLRFVYTGKPEGIREDTATDLYEAADEYAVLSLKAACVYWMVRNLAEENCVQYLRVAHAHSDTELKVAVISFITENPSVLKGEAWMALSGDLPVLANEVFQSYVSSTLQ